MNFNISELLSTPWSWVRFYQYQLSRSEFM